MYRFRPIEALLDKYNELENQEIYFASPEELNDPMEGYKDIFWKGDTIVWENFFKNYIKSVENFFETFILIEEKIKLNEKNIVLASDSTQYKAIDSKFLLQQIENDVFMNNFIKDLSRALENRISQIRRSELLNYLDSIHPFILQAISGIYLTNGFIKKPFWVQPFTKSSELVSNIVKTPSLINELIEKSKKDEKDVLNTFLLIVEARKQQNKLSFKYDLKEEIRNSNRYFLIDEFPEKYLARLEKSIYPDWYSASFLGHCDNSAVWGHYGNNHTGVCLKFKVAEVENRKELNLQPVHGDPDGPIRMYPHVLRKIDYSKKSIEVDFFRSIGLLPIKDLMTLWYSDSDNNVSNCASHIEKSNQQEWLNTYWENFYKSLTAKLIEWKYENEYRLIIHTGLVNFSENSKRKFKYNFQDLEAVIFGIKTDMQAKLKIIDIIKRKCKEIERKEFDFYQTYYSKDSGKIEMVKLDLL